MKNGDIVWYDDSRGEVELIDADRITVLWTETGRRTTVDRSDLLTQTEYEEIRNG